MKVGHAFSDYVTSEHKRKVYSSSSKSLFADLIQFVPLFLGFIVFVVLLTRLFYIQVIRGDYYKVLADENRTRTTTILAPRGIIFDRNGNPLTRNTPAFKILVPDPKNPKQQKVQFISSDDALKRIASGQTVYQDIQREYIYKDAFAHVVGYIGQISQDQSLLPKYQGYSIADFNGKLGLEQQYESLLHGTNGKGLYEVDSMGKPTRNLGEQQPIPGQDLHTTLDVNIQQSVAQAFPTDQKGAVVVSDPRNGAILALYSYPSFDPNLFTHQDNYTGSGRYKSLQDLLTNTTDNPFLDRAIAGAYPPGSTYKLINAIAGLESHAITEDTEIEDTGVIKVGGSTFANWYWTDNGKTEGMVDVVKAIKRSNDIFFYESAAKEGVDTLASWSKKFGMGSKLGIDLPGEVSGTVPDENWKQQVIGDQWYLGDTYHMGIGQGYVLATPLQVNMWTIPFANGGVLYQPHLKQGDVHVIRKDFIDPTNIEIVREGMLQVCQTGGVAWPFFNYAVKNPNLPIDGKDYFHSASQSASLTGVAVGCKTGTAETDAGSNPHAWFTAFAPFYHPEIAITVLVENSGEGSNVAAPIAKAVLTKYFESKK